MTTFIKAKNNKKTVRQTSIIKYQGGGEGTLDYKLHFYPKFYNHVMFFVGLKTFCTFDEFLLVGSKN